MAYQPRARFQAATSRWRSGPPSQCISRRTADGSLAIWLWCRWPPWSRPASPAGGERRILGLDLAAGNDEGSAWSAFIRSLVERGLHGVRLVISDDHAGLVKAVREQLLGSSWQRCRVHFTRNAQDLVPRSARSMVASAIRAVFEQPDEASARDQCTRIKRCWCPSRAWRPTQ